MLYEVITDPLISVHDRLPILKKYQVKYILADKGQSDQFVNIMNHDNKLIEPVFSTADFTSYNFV